MQSEQIVVGLDIGTSKVACVVAGVSADGKMTVIGMGTHHTSGLRRGMVVHPEKTISAIRLAIEEAELMADVSIEKAYVSIAGNHIRGINSYGVVATTNQKVTHDDIARVIESAKAWDMPANQSILHIIPQEYKIGLQGGIREPLGMYGVRLESRVHIVSADMYAMQNLMNCCHCCDLDVEDMVFTALASAKSVLSQDEKDIGVALVDIGGGTTDMALFVDGSVCFTAVIPIGGDHFTHDLVAGLSTSVQEADKLKKKFGSCCVKMVPSEEMIEVPRVGGRSAESMTRQVMAQLLEPRVSELFGLIQDSLKSSGYSERMVAGIVFTGGSSLLEGLIELAEETFECPVRLGRPQGVGGVIDLLASPVFATAVGLLQYHQVKQHGQTSQPSVNKKPLWKRILHWFG